MDAKECTKCRDVKSLELFAKHSKNKDGLNFWCKQCMSDYRRSYNQTKKAKAASRASSLKHHKANRDRLVADMKVYHQDNRDRILSRQKEYYEQNLPYMLQRASVGRGERAKRNVSWANQQLIDAYYIEAKRLEELTGIQFHVDHIIPLQGDLVSGLHVETNLQLLPAHENIGKSNSFDPDDFLCLT